MNNSNILYDILIIGASRDGIETAISLKKKAPNLKILLISTNFEKVQEEDFLVDIDKLQAKVIFSEYFRGLISLTLQDKSKVFGQNIIIATGTSSLKPNNLKKELLQADNVYYKLADIPRTKLLKNNQIIIVGNSQEAIKAALAISKKVTYVYLCSKEFKLHGEPQLIKQLKAASNIAYLPGCSIITGRTNENHTLTSVTLDTYSKIHCTGLLVMLGSQVDNPGISSKMITTDVNNYFEVNKNCQTTVIPNIYAIGSCCTRPTKAARMRMIEDLIKNNK